MHKTPLVSSHNPSAQTLAESFAQDPPGRLDLLCSKEAGDDPSIRHWLLDHRMLAGLTVNLCSARAINLNPTSLSTHV